MAKDFYKNIVEKLSGYCWNTMTVDELADVLERDMPKLISILQSKCESKNFNGKEAKSMAKKLRDVQEENRVLKVTAKNIEQDYNVLKRLIRFKYPDIWQEFINMDTADIDQLYQSE